jgi:hypothetical protein
MADTDRPGAESNHHMTSDPLPVVPSDKTERPEGLAFDVEPGADLTGVPVGNQTPRHPNAAHTEETVRESGEGVGLTVPDNRPTRDEQ